ncbi:MAG: low temperature requirement protein A [Ectothiorhodospiraceae bacterium]|nr:low temperature requirement protein A [Ectothiorhodospiraceae bacterium]
MASKLFWQRPQLRTDETENKERKATWLELFFDLVFVAVVAQLSHSLAADTTWPGVTKFVLLFVPVWWVWIGSTFYNDRFETDDVSHRLFAYLQMIAVASLAFHVHDGLGASSVGFAISYIAVRVIIIVMWLRGGHHSPEARPLTNRYAIGFSISVALWIVSIFIPPPFRFVLWAAGILIDIITPLTTLEIQRKMPKLSTSHLPERFGLFTIIVLGESIVGVVAGASETHHMSVPVAVTGILGLALSFSMWWLYFDKVASRRVKPHPWWLATWVYTHLFLVLSLTGIGSGILNVVAHDGAILSQPALWLICGSVALSFVTLGLFEFTLAGAYENPKAAKRTAGFRFAGAVLAMVTGLVLGSASSIAVISVLAALAIIQIALILFEGDSEKEEDMPELA